MASWRSYTDQERAAAVGRALAVGAKRAGLELGIPRRTISSWLLAPTPGVEAAIGRSREDVAARLWEGVVAGTDAVVAGLRDPKARLSDKATALRIVVEAHALISGGPTTRVESTVTSTRSDDDNEYLRDYLDALIGATPEERAEYAPKMVAALLGLPEAGNVGLPGRALPGRRERRRTARAPARRLERPGATPHAHRSARRRSN